MVLVVLSSPLSSSTVLVLEEHVTFGVVIVEVAERVHVW